MNEFNLKNRWDQPSKSLPIIFIGAGGIIRNAHLPAYKKLNLNSKNLIAQRGTNKLIPMPRILEKILQDSSFWILSS